MTSKERKLPFLQDECLACLGYFAYSTGRISRSRLEKAFAACTRLDQPTRRSRIGWWKYKFDNIHYAFKPFEGLVIHGRGIAVTRKGGAESSPGLQKALRDGAQYFFLKSLRKCLGHAQAAIDSPLEEDVRRAVFEDIAEADTGDLQLEELGQDQADALSGRKDEGKRRLREHWYLERNAKLPQEAKERFKARNGALFCEICGLLPEPTYGHPIVDAHHKLPLNKYAESGKIKTGLEDFAILCPSCHRAVHKQKDCDMKDVLEKISSTGVKFKRPQGLS